MRRASDPRHGSRASVQAASAGCDGSARRVAGGGRGHAGLTSLGPGVMPGSLAGLGARAYDGFVEVRRQLVDQAGESGVLLQQLVDAGVVAVRLRLLECRLAVLADHDE